MARRGSARTSRSGRSAPSAEPMDAAEDPEARARQICLRLLTIRARTRAELATALGRRGIDEDTAERVLARFGEVGLIDDAAFAESYVHSGHTYQGLGRRALAANLRRRGVDDETVGEAVAAVDPESEEEMARTLVRRRIPRAREVRDASGSDGAVTAVTGVTDGTGGSGTRGTRLPGGGDPAAEPRTVQRLVGMLARRGYSEGLAYRVVREELRAAGQDAAVLDGLDPDTPLG
jgi:regulatory protein